MTVRLTFAWRFNRSATLTSRFAPTIRKLRDEKILGAPIDEPEFSVRRRDDPVILDLKILIRRR